MKECAVDSLEALYTVIAELHMPDEFFRYWTEKTTDAKVTPTSEIDRDAPAVPTEVAGQNRGTSFTL